MKSKPGKRFWFKAFPPESRVQFFAFDLSAQSAQSAAKKGSACAFKIDQRNQRPMSFDLKSPARD